MNKKTEYSCEDAMEIADSLIGSAVSFVKRNYHVFSEFSKEVSENKWEEWVRNHIEAKIWSHGGKTLSGDQDKEKI